MELPSSFSLSLSLPFLDARDKLYVEQTGLFGKTPHFDYDGVKKLEYMDTVLKETLRICPPLIQVMRKVMVDMDCNGYKIPKGHYIAISPSATHHIPTLWTNPSDFNPERFNGTDAEESKGGQYPYLPFGAGRHRCIGEGFAYVQIKTLWSTILSQYEIFPDGPLPKPDYQSLVVLPSRPCNIRYKRRAHLKSSA